MGMSTLQSLGMKMQNAKSYKQLYSVSFAVFEDRHANSASYESLTQQNNVDELQNPLIAIKFLNIFDIYLT